MRRLHQRSSSSGLLGSGIPLTPEVSVEAQEAATPRPPLASHLVHLTDMSFMRSLALSRATRKQQLSQLHVHGPGMRALSTSQAAHGSGQT